MTTVPTGKYAGEQWDHVPSSYIAFLLEKAQTDSRLVREAEQEMLRREHLARNGGTYGLFKVKATMSSHLKYFSAAYKKRRLTV